LERQTRTHGEELSAIVGPVITAGAAAGLRKLTALLEQIKNILEGRSEPVGPYLPC
jgi:hypothetical protein